MKHPKYDLIVAAAAGEQMEVWGTNKWSDVSADNALYFLSTGDRMIRTKPKVIVIGGIGVPESMKAAPAENTVCWVSDPAALNVYSFPWTGSEEQKRLLKRGLLQATETGAEEHREALIRASGGAP